jgi:hypothetical protein
MADLPIAEDNGQMPVTINDPTTVLNSANVKAASTASVAADNSLVVALSPNSPVPTGTNNIGVTGVAQASATAGEHGDLVQGAVTTAAPAYTTGQTSPLSLDTSGNLRVTFAASGEQNVNINQIDGVAAVVASAGVLKVGIVGNTGAAIDAASTQNVATPANGILTLAEFNTTPTTITSGNSSPLQLTSAARLIVDGSQVTQPVSGTFWQTTQPVSLSSTTITGTVAVTQSTSPWVVSGTVTTTPPANASTNITQWDSVALGAPSAYGTAPGAVTVPGVNAFITNTPAVTLASTTITGTVAVTESGTWNITNITGTISLPTGASTSALQTTGNTSLSTIATNTTGLVVAQGSTTAGESGQLTMGAVTTAAPTYTTGQTSPLSLDTAGNLRVTGGNVAQASTTAGQTGSLIQGAVTTANPIYTTGQTDPLSLTTAGALRTDNTSWLGSTAPTVGQKTMANSVPMVIASDQTAIPISGTVTANAGTGTFAISAASLPLPTGAATAALQTAGNATLTAIDAGIPTALGQTTMAASMPVVIASNQSAIPVTLTSTTITGTSTVAGNKTNNAAVPGATNLGVLPALANAAAPTWTEGDQVLLSEDLSGNLRAAVVGNVASGVADAGNPVKIGLVGHTALPAAVTDGQRINAIADDRGRAVSVLGTVRDLKGTQTTTITASVTETTIVTAGAAGVFNDIIQIVVANTSTSTSTRIDFRDATAGTVRFSMQCPANQTTGFNVPGESIPQTTAAANWTAQCATSTTDVRIYVFYEKNQ